MTPFVRAIVEVERWKVATGCERWVATRRRLRRESIGCFVQKMSTVTFVPGSQVLDSSLLNMTKDSMQKSPQLLPALRSQSQSIAIGPWAGSGIDGRWLGAEGG